MIITFTIGDVGYPQDGATSYYNPALAGKTLMVIREGKYQYRFGLDKITVPGNGSIFFSPALQQGERMFIRTR